jgi:outer membrane receptor protein involved in Fe transport
MRKTSILKAGTAPIALGLMLAAAPAFAQDQNDSEEGAAGPAPTITVTGSRIARPNIEGASPVTVLNQEQIQLTGTTTLESILNELPQLIPGNTRVSNNAGGQRFATLDLRGLGPGRTLILLNGERLPASSTTGVVDVSQIPTGLIQRVEVLTGGASATYGSDAMAGVINFILRDDYQGVELTAQRNFSEDGAFSTYTVEGIVGGNFADGKGNFTFYGSWTDRNGVFQGRYPYSRVSGAVVYDPNVGVGVGGPPLLVDDPSRVPAGYVYAAGGGSATPPWGWGTASSVGPAQFNGLAGLFPATFGAGNNDTNCDGVPGGAINTATQFSFNDAGQFAPRNTAGACNIPLRSIGSSRYNFAPVNYLITPYDRLTLTAIGTYNFNEKTSLKIYSSYTNANQQVALAPTPAMNIVVPANSPLIPADLRAALATRTYSQRAAGVDANGNPYGAARFANTTACTRSIESPGPGGVSCTTLSAANEPFVFNRRFSETGPRIGDFSTDAKSIRAIVDHRFNDKWSVNLVGSFGRIDNRIQNQGNIRRSAVTQGLNGCPTGSGPGCVPINIFGPNTLTPPMLSFVALTTTDTESFEQLRVATNLTGSLFELPGGPVGIAVGAEYRKDTGVTQVDDAKRTGDIIGFNAQGSISGSIKVTEVYGEIRVPVVDLLTIGAGARYSDYSTIGGLFNWKAEGELTPVDWIKIRGSYNRAARAPNVFELFQNGDQGFPSYVDPCNDTPARTAAILARCQASAPGFNFTGFQQVNSQVQAFAFGDPTLKEEKAETWTAGLVLDPGYVGPVKLQLTADYYNIKLTNRVAGLGATFYISQCFVVGDPTACARIVRDPVTGQIESVRTGRTNSPTPLTTAGIDVGLDASIEAFGGQIYVNDVLTYVDKFKIGDSEFVDTVFSGIGGVTPRWANTLQAGWRSETVTVQVRYVWKKGGKQNFPGAEWEGFFPDSGRIPDLNLVNLSLRFRASERVDITGIVNNLLDKYPPQTVTGYFEQANTNINFYDPYAVGRNFTIQARVRF